MEIYVVPFQIFALFSRAHTTQTEVSVNLLPNTKTPVINIATHFLITESTERSLSSVRKLILGDKLFVMPQKYFVL